MSDWTSGYVADIGYTYGYYIELNPNRAKFALLMNGYAPSPTGVHCELGFGQGLSVNIHAAASGSTWYGNDFNPSQAAFAQTLTSASGANANLTDEAFVEFCNRLDLPNFDSIGLHGIWSWISDENRVVIVDFIRRKLKVGGVLYVSYNTLPGWASFSPMRHLMTEQAAVMGVVGNGVISQVDSALEFAQKLLDTNPMYAKANPGVVERLHKVSEQNRHYLAHEYFNKDWHPMYFATMGQWLAPAKLTFACSAHYLDHIDAINLTPQQQAMLKEIPDPTFKESVRDFMVNQQFRRDYWVKGELRLSPVEKEAQLCAQRVILIVPRDDVNLKVKGTLLEADMKSEIYLPVLDLMADYEIRDIGEIYSALKSQEISLANIIQVVLVMTATSQMALAQEESVIASSSETCLNLNLKILERARSSTTIPFLASPVTGGGIYVDQIHQLFLLSYLKSRTLPNEWAQDAWQIFETQGRRFLKDGKELKTEQDNLEELMLQAKSFKEKNLKLIKQLKIIDF